ncbi:hypothetical protein [Loktanella sp. S4079]|uniref:hypothetical protein n=1 Tax=Loktanella sp. S4079 TaxID=579483 RepID=UPI0005F9BDEE|nr:hypothetical protein [Loktanella sp. S4079]KJZ20275.1 hypothetical protein TW80_05500 [Loktanella sp. S4079]
MNIDRLINMGLRMLMNKGINKGIDMAAKRGKRAEDMTPEERQAAKNAGQNMHKARRGMNIMRRFMR